MAGFKFKLEFMIKMRRRKEEEAMARLAKRLASIKMLQDEILSLHEQKQALSDELQEKIKSGLINAPLLKLYADYKLKLNKDISRAEEFLHLSRKEEAKERAALTKASVDLKIIEKLKEKKKAEFVAEQLYIEQNNLEEMASLAKARRDREEAFLKDEGKRAASLGV